MDSYDVVIVGAGPAGLSAALILGRCRRRVLICDSGSPRNAASHALHGFITRDGIPPLEFLRIAREQLQPYPSLEFRHSLDQTVCSTISNSRRATHWNAMRCSSTPETINDPTWHRNWDVNLPRTELSILVTTK